MKKKVRKSKLKWVIIVALCLVGAYEYKVYDSLKVLEHRILMNTYVDTPNGKLKAHCVATAFKESMGGWSVIHATEDWFDFLAKLSREETETLIYNMNKCELYYENK